MKFAPAIIAAFTLALASAQEEPACYATKPGTGGHPFPTAIPVAIEGKTLSESQFDWNRYITEAVSLGDEMFRANLAFSNGFTAYDFGMLGTMNTALDEETRNETAAEEVAKNCLLIESMYRERLKGNAEQLTVLESFVAHHRNAITASVALVGHGRDGAPGAKAAISGARLNAFIVYRSALLDLRSIPCFRDCPMIAFPTPERPIPAAPSKGEQDADGKPN